MYADIVLPATWIYESWDIYDYNNEEKRLIYSKPPLDLKNIGEVKDEWSIFAQIAEKLELIANKEENLLLNKVEDDIRYTVSGFHDLSAFYQEYINQEDVFNPLGTDELAYNMTQKKLNKNINNDKINTQNTETKEIQTLPNMQEEPLWGKYDFIFKKSKYNQNTNYSTSTLLLRLQRGESVVIINKNSAKTDGFKEGEKVKISNEFGEFISKLKTSSSTPPGVLIMHEGWESYMFKSKLGYSEILSQNAKIRVNLKRVEA
ncbi:MAG: hypothetical protein L3J44_02420 [Campylobacteraceae bacterium]|nr:hypothetical protein [Campylobacteraceae bacterium]